MKEGYRERYKKMKEAREEKKDKVKKREQTMGRYFTIAAFIFVIVYPAYKVTGSMQGALWLFVVEIAILLAVPLAICLFTGLSIIALFDFVIRGKGR